LLPADCAGRPCPLCGGPVDAFGGHVVSCKKSGFGDRNLGTQTFFCQVLTQSRVPHDREMYVAGNGRRPADILLKAWDGRRDLAVDLTIVQPNPVAGRPLRGSAATFSKDKGDHKCRESADSCGRMGVDFSPMVFDTWGGAPRGREGGGEGGVHQVHRPAPARRPPSGSRCPEAGPQRATGLLGVPAAGGPYDGIHGDTGVVGCRSSAQPPPSRRRVTRSGESRAGGNH